MTNSQHTPGPFDWRANDHDQSLAIVSRNNETGSFNNTSMQVARLYGPDRFANKDLFLAAPELLEALEYVLGHASMAKNANALGQAQSLMNVAERARKAINKAKGL